MTDLARTSLGEAEVAKGAAASDPREVCRPWITQWLRLNGRFVSGVTIASGIAGFAYGEILYDGGFGGYLAGTFIAFTSVLTLGWLEAVATRWAFWRRVVAGFLGVTLATALGLSLAVFTTGTRTEVDAFSVDALIHYWTRKEWWRDVLFSFEIAAAVVVLNVVNQLIGPGRLWRILVGAYHHPREETRIVVFFDVAGSTGIAERVGPLRFHALLQEIFAEVSATVALFGGEVHQFIGDGVYCSWQAGLPDRNRRALLAVLRIRRALQAPAKARKLAALAGGAAPDLRATLALGPVVAGEVGVHKREILFLGDTVNLAARLHDSCKEHGVSVVITDSYAQALPAPTGWRRWPLGSFAPRGREAPVEIHAVATGPGPLPGPPDPDCPVTRALQASARDTARI